MKQLNYEKDIWDNKIQIEMTLLELQEIVDCCGTATAAILKEYYGNRKAPYSLSYSHVYDSLCDILKQNGSRPYCEVK